jgi:hypothetical protein
MPLISTVNFQNTRNKLILKPEHKRNRKTKRRLKNVFIDTAKLSAWVRFEIFTAVVMKSIIFWDVSPCSLLSLNRRFGGTYRLLLATCLLSCSCWNYFFDPEDGGDMFLRNVGCNSTDYTASHPRRWYSCLLEIWSSQNGYFESAIFRDMTPYILVKA